MSRTTAVGMLIVGLMLCGYSQAVGGELNRIGPVAPGLNVIDPYTLRGAKNLISDYAPHNPDGTINVVVEIPAGTNAKWEVAKTDGSLRWEFKKGKPRVVQYLAYPANYGMVPQTLLPKELGGDGDPLDVVVLGPATARGEVVKARLVGVLRLLDGGEQDDKLLAVIPDGLLGEVHRVTDLEAMLPGSLIIIETWFANYKGPGEIRTNGFANVEEATRILDAAAAAYQHEHSRAAGAVSPAPEAAQAAAAPAN